MTFRGFCVFMVESVGCIAGLGLVLFLQHPVPAGIWVMYCLFFM